MSVACAAVFAQQEVAGISTHIAILACEAQRALASVVVNAIHAGARVATWVMGALVDVDFTTRPFEARAASAHQVVAQVQTVTSF